MRRIVTVTAIALAFAALAGGPVFAGKPGTGGGGGTGGGYTVTVSPAGPYSFGQAVNATTNVPESMSPWISLACRQNGVVVLGDTHAGFSSGWYYNWPFYLGPSQSWQSGPADCTISVTHSGRSKTTTDAQISFHVNG